MSGDSKDISLSRIISGSTLVDHDLVSSVSLGSLPGEIFLLIAIFLHPQDILSLRTVSGISRGLLCYRLI